MQKWCHRTDSRGFPLLYRACPSDKKNEMIVGYKIGTINKVPSSMEPNGVKWLHGESGCKSLI